MRNAFTDLPQPLNMQRTRELKPAFASLGPDWGDLRPVLSARLVHLDIAAFTEWMAGEAGFARSTIEDALSKLRRLEREGFNAQTFLQSPDHARLEVRRIRARMRLAGAPDNTIRHCEVNWNRIAQYAATIDPRFEGVAWDLTPEVKGQPKTFNEGQHAAIMAYRCGDELVEKRRRALIWLTDALGWRRSEIARMRIQDLNQATGMAYMAFPAKRSAPMWWPLPRDAWSPKRPLQVWLAVRPVDQDAPQALWTYEAASGQGRAYKAIGGELDAISKDLGFRVGFTRFRRYDTTRLDEAGVHPRIIQRKRNHKKLDTTMHYMGQVTPERALAELVRVGAPGFAAAGRRRRAVDVEDELAASEKRSPAPLESTVSPPR